MAKYLGIPFTALISVVLGLFLASFPIGLYVVFNSDIGGPINYELPLTHLDEFAHPALAPLGAVTLGDIFVAMLVAYAVVLVVAALGPKEGFLGAISTFVSGREDGGSNYMVGALKWFSVLVAVSALASYAQEYVGVPIAAPSADNDLLQLFYITLSPLVEETFFRAILIGAPLFLMHAHRHSAGYALRCLWRPANLPNLDMRKAVTLIVLAGAIFGISHVAFGGSWTEGKAAQATMAGIILGWAYVRYGFAAALLIHWATNYFIYAYANFVAQLNLISVEGAFSHSMMSTLESILLLSGGVSAAMLVACRIRRAVRDPGRS